MTSCYLYTLGVIVVYAILSIFVINKLIPERPIDLISYLPAKLIVIDTVDDRAYNFKNTRYLLSKDSLKIDMESKTIIFPLSNVIALEIIEK